MRIGIIADDLTGANDSGVQLSRAGLQTSVRFNWTEAQAGQDEAIVIDTDSRSIPAKEAYQRVHQATEALRRENIEIIYKKIDSTLRGNIGAELDAVYDVMQPDFVVIAPGYPINGRTVVQGTHYLKGVPLHETEISRDPKCPVTESYIPQLLQKQTERPIGHITVEILAQGYEAVRAKLKAFKDQQISYVLFDSVTEQDLEHIAHYVRQTGYSVVWLGSAGLANYLPAAYHLKQEQAKVSIPRNEGPILLVVGSVTNTSRKQLKHFLKQERVRGIELDSAELVASAERVAKELNKGLQAATQAYLAGEHVALYSTGDREAIKRAQAEGARHGLKSNEVSNKIVLEMGELVQWLLQDADFKGIIMTGGDTAKQICNQIGVSGIRLIDEVETGVPIGQLIGGHELYAVTKAGAFGTEETFTLSMQKLQGVDSL